MLKPFVLFSAVALLAFAPSLATSQAPAKSTPETQAKAKQVYKRDCALCHGDTGDGKTDLAKDMQLTLADWTDPKSLAGMNDKSLFDIIRQGKNKMPAEESGRASDAEVWGLVTYIRSLAQAQPAAPPPPAAASPAPQGR
jgi:mono/diheme cytochrome c family protein